MGGGGEGETSSLLACYYMAGGKSTDMEGIGNILISDILDHVCGKHKVMDVEKITLIGCFINGHI